MAIRFLIGRAGSGKTERCLQEIREKLLRQPDGHPLILLVPEQATFQAEHALVTTPGIGGLMRAQVLSFRRLAWRVMQETGGTAGVPIDELGKKMLLQRLLHKYNGKFRMFRSAFEKMGFVDNLHGLLSEFKRYQVTPGLLEGHVNRLSSRLGGETELLGDKLHDLLLVYRDYEEELAAHYLDGEQFLTLLAEQLHTYDGLRDAEVWIDGFFGFTPQEHAVVAACMAHCRDVTVSLTLNRPYLADEKPHELDLFHPTATTMCRLQEEIRERNLPRAEIVALKEDVPPRFGSSPMLAYLEKQYEFRLSAGRKPYQSIGDGEEEPQLTIAAAVHRRAEVEAIAREMRGLVREKGLRWRDLAVRVRNIEDYGDLLASVFSDYGIPYFFDQKRSVMHHPLVEFIRSALETVVRHWPYDAVFRCIKTEFLMPLNEENGSLAVVDKHAMDRFENYVLAYGIQGSRWLDPGSWERKPQLSLDDEDGMGIEAAPLFDPDLIKACAETVVGPLGAFYKRLKQASDVKGMAEAMFSLLEELRIPEKLTRWGDACIAEGRPEKAREHGQMWDAVVDVLDQMAELMGDEPVSPELFAKLVDTGLESLQLGLVPPALDQVLIGSIDRTRSTQIKHAFVLGVNDGVLPKKMNDDGIIAENEREFLLEQGVPMAESSRRKLLDEQFLIYTVLCAPSHRLWLSYPLADEEGKSLLPSEIIRQLLAMFPNVKEKLIEAEPASAMAEDEQSDFISHPERTLSYLTVQLKQWMNGSRIAPVWWDVYNWYAGKPEWRDKLRMTAMALFYTNREKPLSLPASRLLYGGHLKASVSRMERFVACPFSQFASHGLRLAERRMYRLEAPDIGQLFHAALSGLAKELAAEQSDWGAMSEEDLLAKVSLIVDRLAPRLQNEILASSSRYRYLARKLKGIVGRASVMLAEHGRQGEFRPVGLEVGFGPGSELPPLAFQLPNGSTMEIIGRIDRVDRAAGDSGMFLRVIDYKSSPTALRLSELYYGLTLQMLTYLDVVLTHAERWLGQKAKPAGVLYFHVHNPVLPMKNVPEPAVVEAAMRKQFKMRGLVTASAEAVYLMDRSLEGKSGHSDLIPVALKGDGSFYKNASVASETQWEQMRSHVRQVIRRIGTEITGGNVAIEPYRMGKKTACTFCSFKSVCQYDPLFEGNGQRLIRPYGKEDVWLALEESAAQACLLDGGRLRNDENRRN